MKKSIKKELGISKKDYVYVFFCSDEDGHSEMVFQALNRYIASEKIKELEASGERKNGGYYMLDGSEID